MVLDFGGTVDCLAAGSLDACVALEVKVAAAEALPITGLLIPTPSNAVSGDRIRVIAEGRLFGRSLGRYTWAHLRAAC